MSRTSLKSACSADNGTQELAEVLGRLQAKGTCRMALSPGSAEDRFSVGDGIQASEALALLLCPGSSAS